MSKVEKHGKHHHHAAGHHKAGKKDDDKKADKGKHKDDQKAVRLPGSWQADFEKADKNHDGKLKKSELKIAKKFDADGNKTVTKTEFHVGHRKANSFTGLDADGNGSLNQKEMSKARRFTKESYDGDGDGNITEQEFTVARRTENVARKEARRDAEFKNLSGKDKKALKRYDADGNGAITREEFGAGKDQDWKTKAEAKIAANFARAGAKDGVLKADATYKSYDKDGDGNVNQEEFRTGQYADRKQYWDQALKTGGADGMLVKRLVLNAHGMGLNKISGQPGTSANPADPSAPGGASGFNVSSFNLLGSSHTAAGGKHPGMASGPERMKGAIDLLKQHDVDVVGFQEMEGNQLAAFQRMAGKQYGIYPGNKLGKREMANSIAWNKDKFELVKADHVDIPYFNGNKRKMPYVLLRDKQTGKEVYVANFHNPADTARFHHQQKYRDEATRREIALANRLRKTGIPVIMTGDMNEGNEYYNRMTRGSRGMHASSANRGRPKHPGIDWIFGSPNVTFTRHVRDRSAKVRHTTDHPMIVSHAQI